MVKTPRLSRTHSAAITAPNAKPLRLWAVCFNSMSSIAEVQVMVCVPGTLSMRFETIPNTSALSVVLLTHDFFCRIFQ